MSVAASFGWRSLLAPERSVVEAEEAPGFGMARVWISNGEYDFVLDGGSLYVALTVEGSLRYRLGAEEWTVGANDLVVLRGGTRAVASFTEPIVEFRWRLTSTTLSSPAFAQLGERPVAVSGRARDALVSVTNSLLNHRSAGASAALQRFGLGVEELIAAALLDRPAFDGFETVNQDGLLIRAQAAIEENFRDPSFNVEALSGLLHISGPTLHRPYQRLGTTPRTELERRRVREVLKHLPDRSDISTSVLAQTAESSGFRSTRQLQRALRRFREAQDAVSRE